MPICVVLLENNPLKEENQKLQERLERRNEQLKILAQNIAEHRMTSERLEKEIEVERCKTEDLLELIEGLRITVQTIEATKSHEMSTAKTNPIY